MFTHLNGPRELSFSGPARHAGYRSKRDDVLPASRHDALGAVLGEFIQARLHGIELGFQRIQIIRAWCARRCR
jgi:hypothetical protein